MLSGEKVATCALLVQYEDEGEPLPRPGERRLMVDSSARPVATIEVRDVRVLRLGDADHTEIVVERFRLVDGSVA